MKAVVLRDFHEGLEVKCPAHLHRPRPVRVTRTGIEVYCRGCSTDFIMTWEQLLGPEVARLVAEVVLAES